jgi:hypothetical protein
LIPLSAITSLLDNYQPLEIGEVTLVDIGLTKYGCEDLFKTMDTLDRVIAELPTQHRLYAKCRWVDRLPQEEALGRLEMTERDFDLAGEMVLDFIAGGFNQKLVSARKTKPAPVQRVKFIDAILRGLIR